MIYYFSGTHNSRYAALRLASLTGQEARFIPTTDANCQSLTDADLSVGFVFPIYAWGVPPIVVDFIRRLPESFFEMVRQRGIAVWAAVTCGDETGNAIEMLRKTLAGRGVELRAAWSVIMPNVYVMLPGFGTDPKPLEEKKLRDAVGRIAHIGECISNGRWETDLTLGSWPRLKTAAVYPLFRRWGVDAKKWHFTDSCIGCGKCSRECPVGNITMHDGHPAWGSDCTGCCACYHCCPTHSAHYGRITLRQGQFFNEE